MQACDRLSVPIQIRQEQKSIIWVYALTRIVQQDILLFRAPFEDIENPVQAALISFLLHIRPHMAPIDFRRLGHHSNELWRIFLDVLFGAGVDEIHFQIWNAGSCLTGRGKIPTVYVIIAKVLNISKGRVKGLQRFDIVGKCSSFGNEKSWRAVNGAKERDPTAALICTICKD